MQFGQLFLLGDAANYRCRHRAEGSKIGRWPSAGDYAGLVEFYKNREQRGSWNAHGAMFAGAGEGRRFRGG